MSLLFYDGFDHVATADVATKWNFMTGCTVNAGIGRNGSSALFGNDQGSNRYATVTLAPASPILILGFGLNLQTPVDVPSRFLLIYDAAGAVQNEMILTPTGVMNFYRGAGAALLGSTSAALSLGSFVYVEIKITVDDSVGTLDVRFNGISVLSLTGLDTKQTATPGWATVQLGAFGGDSFNGRFSIDDVYICDGSGAAPSNTFLGPVRVVLTLADAAGSTTQFSASAGANYTCVDETQPNGDTDYVGSATVGQIDTYNFAALGVTGTVLAVQTNLVVRSAGGGSETVAPVVRIGGTNYVGTPVGITTSYLDKRQIYEKSPATAVAWTVAEIDAAEFGLKLAS